MAPTNVEHYICRLIDEYTWRYIHWLTGDYTEATDEGKVSCQTP
jgi:hypothetical protein